MSTAQIVVSGKGIVEGENGFRGKSMTSLESFQTLNNGEWLGGLVLKALIPLLLMARSVGLERDCDIFASVGDPAEKLQGTFWTLPSLLRHLLEVKCRKVPPSVKEAGTGDG